MLIVQRFSVANIDIWGYGIILIPIAVVAIGLFILLIHFFEKVRKAWLWGLLVFILIIMGHHIANTELNDFKSNMVENYPEIENIELKVRYAGRYGCVFYIGIENEVPDKQIETIFIEMMKEINKERMAKYLKRKNKNWRDIRVIFSTSTEEVQIVSEVYLHSDWFTEENQQIQIWKNGRTGETYNYSVYME